MKRAAALVVVVLAVTIAAWWALVGRNPLATGTTTFATQDIAFEYPADWGRQDMFPGTGGMGSLVVIVGTQPWGPCVPFDINCHYEQRLNDGELSLEVMRGAFPESLCELGATRSDIAARGPDDPPATGRLMRVDGRPTVQTDYQVDGADYYRADEWRSWRIAAPGSVFEVYDFHARYRGDVAGHRAALDELIASVRFNPTAVRNGGGPIDCGDPFPPGV